MRKIILVSHGGLAKGMKDSVEMIAGKDERVIALGLQSGCHPDGLKQKVERWLKQSPEDEFIIVCDVFGGSVANAMMYLYTYKNVHVLTGMNLGLIISLCTASENEVTSELIRTSLADASKYMLYVNDILANERRKV